MPDARSLCNACLVRSWEARVVIEMMLAALDEVECSQRSLQAAFHPSGNGGSISAFALGLDTGLATQQLLNARLASTAHEAKGNRPQTACNWKIRMWPKRTDNSGRSTAASSQTMSSIHYIATLGKAHIVYRVLDVSSLRKLSQQQRLISYM